MLGSARELDHRHLHHYYYQQQLGAINNYCSVQQPEFFKEQLIGAAAAAAAAVDDLDPDLDHHQQRQQLQQHHHHLQQQQQRLYGVLEPTSVLDLWSPSPSSKGGGCCSGVSSSGGQLNNDHVAARLAAAAAAAAAAHGSPTSFDSNASEKSVEAARRFLDQEEEEQRRRRWKTGGGGAKNAAVSSRWKSGEEAEAERREMLARRARDKSLDEWLADLQQQKLLHLPAAEEELELTTTRGLFFQSPPASSSSNTAATGHRRGAEVEIFPPPPPAASSAGALEQGYGIEELERMLLSPGGGGGGGGAAAANHHHHQLAKWLLGEQQDHQFFPAKEEDLVPSGFVAKDSTIFFPQASAPTPSFFDPAALLPVIQQQAAVLRPPRARIVPQHQDISLEQLFHPPPLVDPAQFSKNGIAANAGLGHFAERSVPGESRLARHRVEGQSFPSQVLDWEIDRKRKSPQLENHYPPKLLELASPRNAAAAAAGANPFDSSPLFAVSPWQHCAEPNRPQSKLQRLDNNRYSRCRNEATAAAANPAAAAAAAPAPFPAAIPANVAVSVPDEGLGLMDQLLHLAQAIDVGSNDVAQSILARLNQHLFCHQGKRIQRLAFYFKEALAARMADQQQQQEHHLQHRSSNFDLPPPSAKNNTIINGVATETSSFGSAKNNDATPPRSSSSIADIFTGVKAYTSYCELSPLLRFAYLSANQAILESIQGEASVHIIDFDPGFGSQWPALLEDIAKTPASLPQPRLRLTLVGPDRSRLEFVAESLGEYAAGLPNLRHSPQIGLVQCSHPGVAAAAQLGLAEGEPVVVNFMFSLHRSLAVPGGADGGVRGVVAATSPRLVTVAEQEVDDNDGKFQRRFVETLQYYAFVLDSLGPEDGAGVLTVERDILAPDIANAVSAEGWRRTERHERLAQWRVRLSRAGLEAVPMGEAARMQAECLIKGHSHGKNFEVCREEGGLLLGWQGKPLVAVSSWTPASCSSSAMEGSNTSNTNNNDNNNVNNSSGNININNNV